MADRRYKFRPGEKAIVIADLGDISKTVDPRRGMLDAIDQQYPGRRLGGAIVTPYDLGQINTGSAESPVWSDHPILYTPGYTWLPGTSPPYTNSRDHIYQINDAFGQTQYQAYLDMLFDIPIEEWATTYRKVEWMSDELASFHDGTYPDSNFYYQQEWGAFTFLIKPYPTSIPPVGTFNQIWPDLSYDPATHDSAYKQSLLNSYGLLWSEKGIELSSGAKLEVSQSIGFANPRTPGSAFTPGTFKITEAPDFDSPAADFNGSENPTWSGQIDVYIFPLILFFWAWNTDHTGYRGERYMLGMQWECAPRHSFPYIEELNWSDNRSPFGVTTWLSSNDPNSRKYDWIEYQKARTGRRCSKYHMDTNLGTSISPINQSGTEMSVLPSAFPNDFFTCGFTSAGSPGDGSFPTVHIANFSIATATIPHLMLGAFKLQGKFYYVWASGLSDDGDLGPPIEAFNDKMVMSHF